MVGRPSQREFLRTVRVAAGTSVLGSAALSGGQASTPDGEEACRKRDETLDRERHTILAATNYEIEVYTIEAENPSPTVLVTDSMHGNERTDVEAAHLITEYRAIEARSSSFRRRTRSRSSREPTTASGVI